MKRPTLHNDVAWAQDRTFVVLEDEGEAPANEDAVVKRYSTVKGRFPTWGRIHNQERASTGSEHLCTIRAVEARCVVVARYGIRPERFREERLATWVSGVRLGL